MIKKAIVAIVIIVAAAAVVFAAAGNIGHTNQENQQSLSTSNNVSDGTTSDNKSPTMISSNEAKEIAQKYIEEPGATAGTPTLSKTDGKYVYTVPVLKNGKNVGEIDIDAQTGENMGGAGGAP